MADETKKVEPGKLPGEETPQSGKPTNKWRDIIKGRNNDLNVDDDDEVSGYLSGEFERLDKSDETNKRMNELIESDPRNASLLNGIFSGKGEDGEDFNLVDYLLTEYYDELKGSTSREDLIEKVNKRMAEKEASAAQASAREKEVEENFQKMNEALGGAIKQTGVDAATAQQMLNWLYGTEEEGGLYLRIPQRAITEDDFVKLIHAFTREGSLESAREEGRREGRKARPGNIHRSATAGNTDLGGGGGEREPEEDKNPTATRYGNMRPRF